MMELFPEINQKINRLNEINSNPDLWEETEKLNKELIEVD
jgi:hypothetical protein